MQKMMKGEREKRKKKEREIILNFKVIQIK